MAQHKFFSGLPQKMELRAGQNRPNRQKSQFFWPEDEPEMVGDQSRKISQSSSKDSGAWDASNYDTDSTIVKDRRNQQLQSKIEFYDPVDDNQINNFSNRKITNMNKITNNDVRYIPMPDPNVIKNQKLQNMESKIEFYDYVNDNETVKNDASVQKIVTSVVKPENIQTVNGHDGVKEVTNVVNTKNQLNVGKEYNIEVVNEAMKDINIDDKRPPKPPSARRIDYDSYDSDDEYLREKRRLRKLSSRGIGYRQDAREEYEYRKPPSSRRPPRPNYDYDDEYGFPIRPSSRERYERYDGIPRNRGNHYDDFDSRPIGRPPASPRRNVDEYCDDRYYDGAPTPRRNIPEYDFEPIDRDYYYEEPLKDNQSNSPRQKSLTNGHTQDHQEPQRRPLRRAMSICSDAPSDISRAMSQRHLKSNIFFTDRESVNSEPRPRTVRDSATSRVSVGLPDIY